MTFYVVHRYTYDWYEFCDYLGVFEDFSEAVENCKDIYKVDFVKYGKDYKDTKDRIEEINHYQIIEYKLREV